MPFLLIGLALSVTPVIIDTDMGSDDMMAIALILTHREIPIEAITVVEGLAHVPQGAANARRLIAASGRTGIPVFEGRQIPLQQTQSFPAEWRATSDRPISALNPPPSTAERAELWLQRRLKDAAHPVRILALGPLTNLALAQPNPKAVEELVVMGGAFHVPGNLTKTAEANFHVDPEAAAQVFSSGVPIRVIPLDSTNQVKLDASFVTRFNKTAQGPLAEIVAHLLASNSQDIAHGNFYAWDPLAAAALLDPSVATWTPAHVVIEKSGRSSLSPGPPNAKIALTASPQAFYRVFFDSFAAN